MKRLICSEVQGLRTQMQDELQEMKKEMQVVKAEMLGMKGEMKEVVQEEVKEMRAEMEEMRGSMKALSGELEVKCTHVVDRVGQIEARVEAFSESSLPDRSSYDFQDAVLQAVNEHKRQEFLSADVRILGLPEELLAGDVKEAVEKYMADNLQVPPGKLASAERIPVRKPGAPSLVIAKCTSKKARIEVVAAGTKFRPAGVFFRSALTSLQLQMLP